MIEPTIDKSEQWKLDGICGKCRRQSYCSKGCKAQAKRVRAETIRILQEALAKKGIPTPKSVKQQLREA